MRLFFFGMQFDRTLKRGNGLLELSGCVETQSEEIGEARRVGFQLESSLKVLGGAFGFGVLAEPNAQSFIGAGIRVGVDSRLQRRGADARCRPNGLRDGQGNRACEGQNSRPATGTIETVEHAHSLLEPASRMVPGHNLTIEYRGAAFTQTRQDGTVER